MSRMEEYRSILQELEKYPPALDGTLTRAQQRRRRAMHTYFLRPAAGLAVFVLIFVLLVNFCAPVAYACSRVPVLRELAAAVTFSNSLSAAVENAYVQTMDLSQTEKEITAEIAYLIVDQKQVNVFYRLDSKEYPNLLVDPEILDADGLRPSSCSYSSTGFDYENGELRCLNIDFFDGNVPDCLQIRLKVYSGGVLSEEQAPEYVLGEIYDDIPEPVQDYIAKFTFLPEFDPEFTAAGKTFPVNQTVMLEGQAITVTDIAVYPTHMRVNIEESQENTAWLKDLEFYIETDWGMKFNPVSSGITATGSGDAPSMVSYRADSTFFYEANHLKLVITGARWLRKDLARTYVNLVTGETGELPDGVAFDCARKSGGGWIVKFRADWQEDEPMHQLFGHLYYDAEGREYEINMWSSTFGEPDAEGKHTFFYDEFPLKNYPYDAVWLCPQYSHVWTADNRIVINVQ